MGFVVGLIVESTEVQGKDKLKKIRVRVSEDEAADTLTIVSNAKNALEGVRCIVATVGTELKSGEKVKKASVGGVVSEGMLCDSAMLSWSGGAEGIAAVVPPSFALGSDPPSSRPRMDGGGGGGAGGGGASAAIPAVEVEPLFEKKLTKEEKKAAAKAKREARKEGKKAKEEGAAAVAAADDGGDQKGGEEEAA